MLWLKVTSKPQGPCTFQLTLSLEPPKFDLDDYISKYKGRTYSSALSLSFRRFTYVAGRTRFDRLLLIGTSSSYLYLEALKAAIAEAKQGSDVGRYESAVSSLREIAPNDPDAILDVAWVSTTKAQVKRNTDTLELELKTYKNNLIKESIRVCSSLALNWIYWLTF